MFDTETARGLFYCTWAAIVVAFGAFVIAAVVHVHYSWNPHDWDCSKHGGLASFATRCGDGYMP